MRQVQGDWKHTECKYCRASANRIIEGSANVSRQTKEDSKNGPDFAPTGGFHLDMRPITTFARKRSIQELGWCGPRPLAFLCSPLLKPRLVDQKLFNWPKQRREVHQRTPALAPSLNRHKKAHVLAANRFPSGPRHRFPFGPRLLDQCNADAWMSMRRSSWCYGCNNMRLGCSTSTCLPHVDDA